MNIIEPIHWIFRQITPESWDSYTALVSVFIFILLVRLGINWMTKKLPQWVLKIIATVLFLMMLGAFVYGQLQSH